MDDERLKNQNNIFGKDYFEEQLARIRDIRSSERRFYQKITDIYTQCSAGYKVDTQATKDFFATVQNKLSRKLSGGNYRANSSRTDCHKSGQHKTKHGLKHLEECTERQHP